MRVSVFEFAGDCSVRAFRPVAQAAGSRLARPAPLLVAAVGCSGCSGIQSALDPAGRAAAEIAQLFWWLLGGAGVVWVGMIALAIYVIRVRPGPHPARHARWLIIGGGAVFPTVVLAAYLVYGLSLMPGLLAPAAPGGLEVSVSGEQWWWRVRYRTPAGETFELANELHLPVGQRVTLRLESPDVIHSFWVPSLAGKMDMIPGRVNRLTLEPTRTGVYRGACAEYCGTAHALMSLFVVVEEPEAFARWAAGQQRAATIAAAADDEAPAAVRRGRALFLENGCGACHTVRGTEADGVVGPDLTHVGGRLSLGAATLANDVQAFATWLSRTEHVKPGVHMPAFGMLPEADIAALAAFLDALQ